MKTCLITGANSGIGKAAALQIAEMGYRVIMLCRDPGRGKAAHQDIVERSGSKLVELMIADMSDLDSVRNLAKQYIKKHKVLDVLIQNAANFDLTKKKRVLTEAGIESIWATNHLGAVLLTELLLDSLRQSAQGRILTVASKGLMATPLLKVDLDDPEFNDRKFSVTKAYYQSKIAQLMYTYWLADKLKKSAITVNCIRVPSVRVDMSKYEALPDFMKKMYAMKTKSALSPQEMAKTYTYLATSEEVKDVSGAYLDEKSRPVSSSKYSREPENIAALMKLTMGYLDLPA